jgi:hypothetical protein
MLRRNADVFIQIERRDFAPIEFQRNQFTIEQWRAARCQTKRGAIFVAASGVG